MDFDLGSRRIIDLSLPLYDNCPGIPDVAPPRLTMLANAVRDGWNLERLDTPLHWGTHMDSPYHQGLEPTMDRYPPEALHGPAHAVDCLSAEPGLALDDAALRAALPSPAAGAVVLLCAGWWRRRGWSRDYVEGAPRLLPSAARWLAEAGVRGVGVEGFSIGGTSEENYEVHRLLLQRGIWIAEGLRLGAELLPPARWHVIALPILVAQSSGAPARVIAVSSD